MSSIFCFCIGEEIEGQMHWIERPRDPRGMLLLPTSLSSKFEVALSYDTTFKLVL